MLVLSCSARKILAALSKSLFSCGLHGGELASATSVGVSPAEPTLCLELFREREQQRVTTRLCPPRSPLIARLKSSYASPHLKITCGISGDRQRHLNIVEHHLGGPHAVQHKKLIQRPAEQTTPDYPHTHYPDSWKPSKSFQSSV